jgi:3-isopropylmalate/(R)-2-methylmalate dehydratase small subunit
MKFKLQGRCWKFGDNIGTDSAILPMFIQLKTHDPKILKEYVMTQLDPDFPKKVRPGDIIVAGKNFGHGNPHIWGYHGIRELGLGLITEYMARGGFRNAVTAGVLFIPEVKNVSIMLNEGDQLEVDFKSGEIQNITMGTFIRAQPLPELILEIIEAGGEENFIRKKFLTT